MAARLLSGRAGAMSDRVAGWFGVSESAETPWAESRADLGHSKVAIVAAAGVFVKGQPPFRDVSLEGDFTFRAIPKDQPRGTLSFGRFWIDSRLAALDPNVVFPIERLNELERKRFIHAAAARHYSLAAYCADFAPLVNGSAKEIARRLRYDGVDKAVVLAASPLGEEAAIRVQRVIEEEGIPTIALVYSRQAALALKSPRACVLAKGALCRLDEYLDPPAQTELLVTMLRQFDAMKRGAENIHEIH